MPDDSEPLTLARYLRDTKMTGTKEKSSVELYYKVGPIIVERSNDLEWEKFWVQHLRPITELIKKGEYELAKDLYTIATAKLVDKKATKYNDTDVVDEVYSYGLGVFAKIKLPYMIRYIILKLAFKVSLSYHSVRLWFVKQNFNRKNN
jgi:hypothetical protein